MSRVIVVGSANVDLVWHGARLPEPGETVGGGHFSRALGGKGANQAAAAAALGAEVHLVGCVGDDEHGAAILADLDARGVDRRHVAVGAEPTGVAMIAVDARGENTVAVAPGANGAVTARAVTVAIDELAGTGAVLVCSLEVPLDTVAAAVTTATARGLRVIVNPAPVAGVVGEVAALVGGTIVTPNEGEADRLGGVDALLRIADAVVVTLGAGGAALHRRENEIHLQPGFAVDVVDTTGAGDAFNGALAWALAGGSAIEDAVRLACAAGALATRALGARAALGNVEEVYELGAR